MSVTMLPTEQHKFYVNFELRPIENREASIEAGHPVFDDVEFAVITMPGGSLVVDKQITEELLNEWKFGRGVKPPSPFALTAYQAWKEGLEDVVNGTDLKNWPGITPAQLKMCQGVNIRTVEDLSEAPQTAIQKMGMGAVALVNKAKSYLENAQDNKGAEKISALEQRMSELEDLLKSKEEHIAELEASLDDATKPAKRGRPKKGDDNES